MAEAAPRDVAPGEEEFIARDLRRARAPREPIPRLRMSEAEESGAEESAASAMLGIDSYGESAGETIEGRDEGRIARRLRERLEQKRQQLKKGAQTVQKAQTAIKWGARTIRLIAALWPYLVPILIVLGVILGLIIIAMLIMALMQYLQGSNALPF